VSSPPTPFRPDAGQGARSGEGRHMAANRTARDGMNPGSGAARRPGRPAAAGTDRHPGRGPMAPGASSRVRSAIERRSWCGGIAARHRLRIRHIRGPARSRGVCSYRDCAQVVMSAVKGVPRREGSDRSCRAACSGS
jgi:hypothetical protein